MTTLREATQQALEALGLWATGRDMDAVALNDLILRLEAALAGPQSTHSADCYKLHHDCAVAEVERLRAAIAKAEGDKNGQT